MASSSLEKRVQSLESQVEKLKEEVRSVQAPRKDWRRAVEKYAGDSDLQVVFAEAMKLREADRKRARASRRGARGKQG